MKFYKEHEIKIYPITDQAEFDIKNYCRKTDEVIEFNNSPYSWKPGKSWIYLNLLLMDIARRNIDETV